MLTGFNTDFKYKGTVYHVQTEDNGMGNPMIVTLLYQGGAILASKKTSYADILKSKHVEVVVKELMEEQHKQIIKDLVAGKFGVVGPPKDEAAAKAAEKEAKKEKEREADTGIFGSSVITDKSLDQVILDYLTSEDNK